jgi:hypothetical protein
MTRPFRLRYRLASQSRPPRASTASTGPPTPAGEPVETSTGLYGLYGPAYTGWRASRDLHWPLRPLRARLHRLASQSRPPRASTASTGPPTPAGEPVEISRVGEPGPSGGTARRAGAEPLQPGVAGRLRDSEDGLAAAPSPGMSGRTRTVRLEPIRAGRERERDHGAGSRRGRTQISAQGRGASAHPLHLDTSPFESRCAELPAEVVWRACSFEVRTAGHFQ